MPSTLDIGMDVRKIVDELMKLERGPVDRMTKAKNEAHLKQTGYNNLEELLSTFSSALDNLGTLFTKTSYSVSSSNEGVVSAASTGATLSPGDYQINVTHCAQANQVASAVFASKDTALALSGTLTIGIGANSFDLTITDTDTLDSIRDNLNNALDNVGLSATILSTTAIDGSSEYRLLLTSNNTGLANAMTFSGDALPAFVLTDQITPAQDAQFTFDNFNVTRSSNNITDLMDGLEINLNGITGTSATISITANTTNVINGVVKGVQAVIDGYNGVLRGIDYVQSRKGLHESMYATVKSTLASAMRQTFGAGALNSLWAVGVSVADTKIMTNEEDVDYAVSSFALDKTELTEQLTNNFQNVQELFTAKNTGVIASINAVIDNLDGVGGPVQSRIKTEEKKEARIDDNIAKEERRLTAVKDVMLTRYAKLNAMVQHYEQVAKFLKEQMDALQKSFEK